MLAKNTLGVINKTIKDFKKFSYIFTIVVQCLFIGFYSFQIYTNLNNMIYLCIYCGLLFLSLFAFIYYLVISNKLNAQISKSEKTKAKKDKKVVRRTIKIFKFAVNFASIIVAIIHIIQFGATDLEIIATTVFAVMWLINVALLILEYVYDLYTNQLLIAVQMDFGVIGSVLELVSKLKRRKTKESNIIEEIGLEYEKEYKEKTQLDKEFNQQEKNESADTEKQETKKSESKIINYFKDKIEKIRTKK